MLKVKLTIEEKVYYRSYIIVEQPEDMSDDDFEEKLIAAERMSDNVDEVASRLKNEGLNVIKTENNFPDNPNRCELEISDIEEV